MSTKRPRSGSTSERLTRRTALTGVATVGLGVPLLTACSGDSTTATDSPAGSSGSTAPSADPGSGTAPTAGSSAAEGGDALTSTADIEVGGGAVFADAKVVVTQPSAGEFKCFTAVCTHTGCLVNKVTSDGIGCPCHGSLYSSEDGSVISGPAPDPLDAVDISVSGDSISLA